MLATVISLVAMKRFRTQADTQRTLADSREAERKAADAARAQVARANSELEASVRRESRINAELRTSDERSRRRFELALEAARGFQTRAMADPTLREPKFVALRRELLGAVLGFYTKLQGRAGGRLRPPGAVRPGGCVRRCGADHGRDRLGPRCRRRLPACRGHRRSTDHRRPDRRRASGRAGRDPAGGREAHRADGEGRGGHAGEPPGPGDL